LFALALDRIGDIEPINELLDHAHGQPIDPRRALRPSICQVNLETIRVAHIVGLAYLPPSAARP
jgi:hypothetical protein